MMVPFQDRARVFQAVVAADRAAARSMDAMGGGLGHKFVTIRRNSLLEVSLLAALGNAKPIGLYGTAAA